MRELALLFLIACGPSANESPRASVPPDRKEYQPRCKELAAERVSSELVDAAPPRPTSLDGGTAPISNADVVIASLRRKFRDCYNVGLNDEDRSMQGCVVMRARITSDGAVASNEAYVRDGLSESVVACIVDVVRQASFSPPGGAGSTLMIPITFVHPPKQ